MARVTARRCEIETILSSCCSWLLLSIFWDIHIAVDFIQLTQRLIGLHYSIVFRGQSWSWSYGSWIYNYLCNQCPSPLKLWVRTPFMVRCTRHTLSYKVCQWHPTDGWFFPGTPVTSTNKTDHHDISESGVKYHKPLLHQ